MKNDNLYIGGIYDSASFGKFRIIRELEVLGIRKERWFEIEFLNTGYKMAASYIALRHGRVKDRYAPTIANVGYVGDLIGHVTYNYNIIFYKPWNDMMNRCYNATDRDYPLYGAIGIKVDEKWHDFSKFKEDAKLLPGYYNKLKYPNEYQLDKDYLQFNVPKNKRIYSRNTCIWISKYDNIMIMNRDNPSSCGYYGVIYKDHSYCTIINGIIYGRFTIPEAAANLYNYIYPYIPKSEFNNIQILNNVPYIPYEELSKYTRNKNIIVGSTTIGEIPSRIQAYSKQ